LWKKYTGPWSSLGGCYLGVLFENKLVVVMSSTPAKSGGTLDYAPILLRKTGDRLRSHGIAVE